MAQTNLYFSFEAACNTSEDVVSHIAFDVVEFHMVEALNQPFVLEVELLSDDPAVDFGKLLDQGATLSIWQGNTVVRRIHGVISNFSQGITGFRRTRYHAIVEPALTRTQLQSDWQIFQQKNIPEILSEVFKADQISSYTLNTQQTHLSREYCVQADETDFDFIQRLVAEEGFVYRFEHTDKGHQLLLSDVIQTFGAITTPMVGFGGSANRISSLLQKLGLNLSDFSGITKLGDIAKLGQLKQLADPKVLESIAQLETFFNSGEVTKQVQGYASGALDAVGGAIQNTAGSLTSGAGQKLGSLGNSASQYASLDAVTGSLGTTGPLAVPGVYYQPNPAGDQQWPAIKSFTYQEQVRTARQTQRDYTFKNPRYSQHQASIGRDMPTQSTEYERYDYPGRYKQDAAGNPFTQTRLLSHRRDAKQVIASGNDARIEPGLAFELTGHPRSDFNAMWRPVRVEHWGKQHTSAEEEAAGAQASTSYRQTAELVPATVEWKAPIPAKPHLHGPEIAHVVGPEGEEIYCDEWGRVKIQFPWDRVGTNNENSSCWIRVAQAWGIGGGDGQQSIPRIGQEVIVDFLDGDPDQPIITARTNDALNPTPYELPKHKTRSTWRSHTHKGEGFNEIRFEDENQQEEIYIHAQKDQNIEVLNNETTWVGNDRSEHVEHNEKIFIGHDRTEQVVNDEAVEIGHDRRHHILNDEFLNIDQNQTITIGNNRIETIHNHRKDDIAANHWQKVGGNIEVQVEGLHQIEAGQQIIRKTQMYELGVQEKIVFKAPGGKITLDAGGITLEGNINIKGPMNQVGSGGGEGISISGSPLETPFGECSERTK